MYRPIVESLYLGLTLSDHIYLYMDYRKIVVRLKGYAYVYFIPNYTSLTNLRVGVVESACSDTVPRTSVHWPKKQK